MKPRSATPLKEVVKKNEMLEDIIFQIREREGRTIRIYSELDLGDDFIKSSLGYDLKLCENAIKYFLAEFKDTEEESKDKEENPFDPKEFSLAFGKNWFKLIDHVNYERDFNLRESVSNYLSFVKGKNIIVR